MVWYLKIDSSTANWSKIYENNYFATFETKLRSAIDSTESLLDYKAGMRKQ